MRELEFGADLLFVNDRINLGITAYRQRISDLTVDRVVAPTTGGLGLVTNVGTMENKGVEIMLDMVPVRTKNLTWDVTVIFNRNRNRVLSLGSPRIEISNVAGAPVSFLEGQPASVFYGFPYARNANGELLLTTQGLPQRERGTQDGLVNFTPKRTAEGQPMGTFVRTVIGNPNPNWAGSFSSSLTYEGLGLRVLLDAVQGLRCSMPISGQADTRECRHRPADGAGNARYTDARLHLRHRFHRRIPGR